MKKLKIILILMPFIFLVAPGNAQESDVNDNYRKKSEKTKSFKIHEHVMVTMKDGSEVEAVVHSHVYNGKRRSKNKYWVREWHSGHQGRVHAKYMRHLTEGEISALHEKKNAKK